MAFDFQFVKASDRCRLCQSLFCLYAVCRVAPGAARPDHNGAESLGMIGDKNQAIIAQNKPGIGELVRHCKKERFIDTQIEHSDI